MVAMMNMLKNLSVQEKEVIMEVLSRDRRLRETEEERVMRLRIELARERRGGFVLSEHGKPLRKRTCARCRESVGFIGKARCPICSHIICKNCRVMRPTGERLSVKTAKSPATAISTKKTVDRAVGTSPTRMIDKKWTPAYNSHASRSVSRIGIVRFSESVSDPENRPTDNVLSKSKMVTFTSTPAKATELRPFFAQTGIESIKQEARPSSHVPHLARNDVRYGRTSSEMSELSSVNDSITKCNRHSDKSFTEQTDTSDYDLSHEASASPGVGNRLTVPQINSVQTSSSEYNETDAVTFLQEMGLNKNAEDKNDMQDSVKILDGNDLTKSGQDSPLDTESVSASQNPDQPPPTITILEPNMEQNSKPTETSVKNPSQIIASQRPNDFTTPNSFISAVGKLFDVQLFKKTFFGLPISIAKLPPVQELTEKADTSDNQTPLKVENQSVDGDRRDIVSGNAKLDYDVTITNSNNAVNAYVSSSAEQHIQHSTLLDANNKEHIDKKVNSALNIPFGRITPNIASTPPTSESYSSEVREPEIEDDRQEYINKPVISENSPDEESSTETFVHFTANQRTDDANQRMDKNRKSLTQHHISGQSGARRRIRKTLKQRMNARKAHLKRLPSSSDGDEPLRYSPPLSQHTMCENTSNFNHGFTNSHKEQPRSHSVSVDQRGTDASTISTAVSDSESRPAAGLWRRSSLNMGLFNKLKERIKIKTEDVPWVCKVCAKSLDLNKKSGDWFYKTARSEVLEFKENLAHNKNEPVDNGSSLLPNDDAHERLTPVSSDAELKPAPIEEPFRRARSHTIETLVLPRHVTSDEPAVGLDKQASLKRRKLRLSRKSVAEVLHGSLLIHIPGRLLVLCYSFIKEHPTS